MTDKPNDLGTALTELGTAFGDMLDSVAFTLAASAALTACLAEDDERLTAALSDLDAVQLRDIYVAATRLAEQAEARHAALTTIPEEPR